MIWRSVFGVIPVPVFYTDGLPEGVGGEAFPWRGPLIRIRPHYRDDEGLHQHELAHIEVFWMTLGLAAIVSMFSMKFRIWNEARAYQRQTLYPNGNQYWLTLNEAAARLSGPRYGFRITQEHAKRLIREA